MTRTKMIGWTAMTACVLGYGGFAILLLLGKMGHMSMTQAVLLGGAAGVVGEIGLWVGAACLGLTLFKKRKAAVDRFVARAFKRKPASVEA